MKHLLIILIALFFLPVARTEAQNDSSTHAFKHSSAQEFFWIGLNCDAGYGAFRDLGAGPVTFHGVELQPSLSLLAGHGSWRYGAELSLAAGGYMRRLALAQPEAYGASPEVQITALREVLHQGPWKLLIGASLSEAFDFRYIPSLGNNSTATSNFFQLGLSGLGEYSLNNWTFHASLNFTPFSLILRPGYAYIANYDHTMENPVADHFSEHHSYITAFNALNSDIGTTLSLPNGNRIGLAYRWHYLTSRISTQCPYRFDRASHTLLFTMLFSIK